jgi:uncharacterized membrane protein YjjP (DUF1212 family)
VILDNVILGTNIALASVALLAALGTINKITYKEARHMVWPVLLIAVGMGGELLYLVTGRWAHVAGIALYGGIASFLLSTQQAPIQSLQRWSTPLSKGVIGIAAVFFLLGLFIA